MGGWVGERVRWAIGKPCFEICHINFVNNQIMHLFEIKVII